MRAFKITTGVFATGCALVAMSLIGCGGEEGSTDSDGGSGGGAAAADDGKGIGPVSEVSFDAEINQDMADAGKAIFDSKCIACHMVDEKLIGPAQRGVLNRHSPEWIMNMMLNPDQMLDEDPTAMALLKEYNNVRMTPLGLSETDARNVLEYFRTISE